MDTNESMSGVVNSNQKSGEQAPAVAARPIGWKSPYKQRGQQQVAPVGEAAPEAPAEPVEPLPFLTQTQPIEELFAPQPSQESTPSFTPEQPQRPNRRRALLIGSGVTAAVALIAGGIFVGRGINNSSSSGAPQPGSNDRQPVAANALPTESAAPVAAAPEGAPQQSFNIPEISASQDHGAIVTQVFEQVVDGWRDAGIPMTNSIQNHKALAAEQQKSGESPEAFASSVSQQASTAYSNALFVPGWEGRSDIQAYIQRVQPMNEKNIYLSVRTANDPQTFYWGVENDNTSKPHITITADAGNEIDATITYTDIENASQNSAGAIDNAMAEPENISKNERLDLKILNVNGSEKISAITAIDLPPQQ